MRIPSLFKILFPALVQTTDGVPVRGTFGGRGEYNARSWLDIDLLLCEVYLPKWIFMMSHNLFTTIEILNIHYAHLLILGI